MAKNLPDIPKCKKCGAQILGVVPTHQLCQNCLMRKVHDGYSKISEAERTMAKDKQQYKSLPLSSIVGFVIALIILVGVVFAALFFIRR